MEMGLFNLQQMDQSSDSGSDKSSENDKSEQSEESKEPENSQKGEIESINNINAYRNSQSTNHQEQNMVKYKMTNELKNNSVETLFRDKEYLAQIVKVLFRKILNSNSPIQNFQQLVDAYQNEKFLDENFPPNENSLLKGYNSYHIPVSLTTDIPIERTQLQKKWKNLKWMRQSEFLNYNTIFPNEIESSDIIPNTFSNPNFISVISALAEFPKRIEKLFLSSDINNGGIYGVKICKDGLLKEIVVDDYLPVDNNKELAFSHDNKNSLWVPILEKCYAKAYGSYNLIELKDVEGILRDLTYAPVVTLDNSNDDLIQELVDAYNNNWIILASAGDTEASLELLRELGLKPDYEYAIIYVYCLSAKDMTNTFNNTAYNDDNYKTLLKIRNLWGDIEWIGDWSEISTFWNEDSKRILNYKKNDSCFYMNLKDFKHYFSKIKICKYFESYVYNSIPIIQKPEDYALVHFSVDSNIIKGNHCYISFVQQDKKNYLNNEYLYGISRLILAELTGDEKTVQYIEGKMGQEREIIIERDLPSGDYLLFCELSKITTETQYVISIYSSEEVTLKEMDKEIYPKILEKIYISCAKLQNIVSTFEPEGAPNCYKYSASTVEGYTYIYFENKENDATLIEDVKYTKFEGLKLLSPFSGTNYKVQIGPGEHEIILIKQLELNEYNLIFSYQSSIQFGKKTLMHLAKEKGNKKKRKDKKLEVDLDIDVYIYKHTFGLCYYYENNTTNKRLRESLNIENNTNVDFVGEKEGTNEVMIIIEPGQTYFIELRGKNNLWKVQPVIHYAIETIGDDTKSNKAEEENKATEPKTE